MTSSDQSKAYVDSEQADVTLLSPTESFLRSLRILAPPLVTQLFSAAFAHSAEKQALTSSHRQTNSQPNSQPGSPLQTQPLKFAGVEVLRAVLEGQTGIDVSAVEPFSPQHFKKVRLEHQIKISPVKSQVKPLPTCTVYYSLKSNYSDEQTGERVRRVVRVLLFIYYSQQQLPYATLLSGQVELFPAVNDLITQSLLDPETNQPLTSVEPDESIVDLNHFIRGVGLTKYYGFAEKYRVQFEKLVGILAPAYNKFLQAVVHPPFECIVTQFLRALRFTEAIEVYIPAHKH